jgi:prepilin-type N-terminal cleavage/methylation domain-containing protein
MLIEMKNTGNGFSLLELLMVLGILSLLAGIGLSGSLGLRVWMGEIRSQSMMSELEAAMLLYRAEAGRWPAFSRSGEIALNDPEPAWRTILEPYLENLDPSEKLEDGFGNRAVFMVIDGDGDHWIESSDFEALAEHERPQRLWRRVVVYSLDGEGKLATSTW